jgi:hypothetical protein
MRKQSLMLIMFLLLLTSVPVSAVTGVSWDNIGDGLWSESAKWNPDNVPDPGDDVFIKNAGTGTITVDTTAAAKTLTVGGAKKISLSTGKLTLATGDYTSADLEGTWNYQGVAAGDAVTGQLPGWVFGSMTVNSAGYATHTAIVDSAGTASYTPGAYTLSINSSGVVTPTIGGTGRCIMTKNKDMMIMVTTGALGSATGVNGYNLIVFTKTGSTFSTTDLEGTWNYQGVAAGDAVTGQLPGWIYGAMTMNSSGYATPTAIVDSAGTAPYTPGSGTFSINSSGVVTPTIGGTGRALMTNNKDMMIMVTTGAFGSATGVNGYNLNILNK